jgi:hypothetical protein
MSVFPFAPGGGINGHRRPLEPGRSAAAGKRRTWSGYFARLRSRSARNFRADSGESKVNTILIVDAVLLGLALVQAAGAIVVFNRLRSGVVLFFFQNLLIFGSFTAGVVIADSFGTVAAWILAGLGAVLVFAGFRSWRRPTSASESAR